MAENCICSSCSSLASHFCICQKSSKLYFCQVCVAQHIVKGAVGHSVLPIEADMLVSSAEDIDIYNSSQEALRAFNASLDSLAHQIQSEEAAAHAIRTEVYEQQAAALYQFHAFIGQELSNKYQSALQEISTIRSELNAARRQISDFSPVTLTFIDSFQHIQTKELIDCRNELQTRIQVCFQSNPPSPYTPLQEILSKWYCQQCTLCLNVKDKFLMKRRPGETQKKIGFWMCGKVGCQRENLDCQIVCDCGFANPHYVSPIPHVYQSAPEEVGDGFPWGCASCTYRNLSSASRCASCGFLKESLEAKSIPMNPASSQSVPLRSEQPFIALNSVQSFPSQVPKQPGNSQIPEGSQRQETAFLCTKCKGKTVAQGTLCQRCMRSEDPFRRDNKRVVT